VKVGQQHPSVAGFLINVAVSHGLAFLQKSATSGSSPHETPTQLHTFFLQMIGHSAGPKL
jgi:hypothetical protein